MLLYYPPNLILDSVLIFLFCDMVRQHLQKSKNGFRITQTD